MARCLIIGCGCRGQLLARELCSAGHTVRGTTRSVDRLPEILGSGAVPVLADPDRVATLMDALQHVTVVCILLGSAVGSGEELSALHGTRLEMLLTRLVDTTARGVVYEAQGSVDAELLAAGGERVRSFAERFSASHALLTADPTSPGTWVAAAVEAFHQVMRPRSARGR